MNGSINRADDDTSPLLGASTQDEDIRPPPSYMARAPTPRPLTDRHVTRTPVHFGSINGRTDESYGSIETSAIISRYKYYSKLAPHQQSTLTMPDHVVPSLFLIRYDISTGGTQPSWITIFSLWNTMMGTSLLSMPWAINQAGFVFGIVLLVAMAGLMLYTSYRILHAVQTVQKGNEVIEFSDVCRRYLGRWAEGLAFVSSLLTLLGGMIVYWILMSNFLYNVVSFIYHHATGDESAGKHTTDPICPSKSHPHGHSNQTNHTNISLWDFSDQNSEDSHIFQRVWDEQKTVPFMLLLVIFPLVNFKSPTFFTKFNALGTVSVTYLVCFTFKNAISWGIHLEFSDITSPVYVHEYKNSFVALTGIAALAYFVHNCVLAITRPQRNPENTVRDLIIAYILVMITYVYIGVIVYISFGLDKDCLEDNFLNNLKDTNLMAFIARIGLFVQMMCVFPLLVFIFRLQFMNSVFGSVWPSWKHVVGLNLSLVGVCIIFAVFLPHIGKIIGFAGAFCGFTFAIALPCLVYMKIRSLKRNLTWPILIIHAILILLGLGNFVGQFLLL